VRDHVDTDQFQGALKSLTDFHGGDCFPAGTLLLRDDYTFVPVEELKEGMKIWGFDRWSEVQRQWYKGILPVTVLTLNNGSQVKLTEDHHVFVALCKKHKDENRPNSQACWCHLEEREIVRITVSELKEGMVLICPNNIPFGKEDFDPDCAWIEGLYIADGCSSGNAAFVIAGKDGFPKEEQKRGVQDICSRLKIPTSWNESTIRVMDKEWALRLQQAGQYARYKHALSIGLNEKAARELLRGIMADSGANTNGNGRTFTTTSRELMVQTRVLHRMCGVSCGYRYVENHGGLGKHPVFRLQTRDQNRSDGKSEKLLRVREIERELFSTPCYDITTDDHYVYLPEHDVTVSQCDCHTQALGALLRSIGYPLKLRIYTLRGQREPGHIALRVNADPKGSSWMTLDASVDKVKAKNGKTVPVYPGWDAATSTSLVGSWKDYAV
jgi:hypothetical protein